MMWQSVATGLLVADFLTAAAHWLEDTYLPYTERPGLLGDIARDNDMHHFVPFAIVSGSWWETCKISVWLVAVLLAVVVLAAPGWASCHRAFLITTAAAMGVANLAHRFQHERDCTRPWVVTMMHRSRLMCSREQHASHHREPSQKYGVLLGFTNYVYDSLGVWAALEGALALLGLRAHARKPGVEVYAALYDDWLIENMARECPEPLSPARLAGCRDRLARARRR